MNEAEIQAFSLSYAAFELPPTNEYISHFFKTKGASVIIYKSGKAVFQGSHLEIFSDYLKETKKETDDISLHPYDSFNTIGSDEVGTGDVFGPIVVATAYVSAKDSDSIKALGVKDSKKISDEDIVVIANKLLKLLKYKVIVVRNETFNDKETSYNLNAMKALLHNQNMTELSKEVPYDYVCLDQFCPKTTYYSYLKNDAFKDVSFEIRGESKSVAVASASIIARYYFLLEMERLKKLYGYDLPKGSGKPADLMIQKIRDDQKEDLFYHLAKLNYKNFTKK